MPFILNNLIVIIRRTIMINFIMVVIERSIINSQLKNRH